MKNLTKFAVAVLLAVVALPAMGLDKEQAEKARKVFAANKDAVVLVTGVMQAEITMGGQTAEREGNFQAIGAVIDASGMVVTSLSSIGASGEQTLPNGQKYLLKIKRHDQVKITLDDGTEVPADVVLKDPDLDLAFIAPRKDSDEYKAAKWTAINLDKNAKVQVLDNVVTIARVGKSLNLEAIVFSGEISGVITKPRKFYLGPSRQGVPAFNLDGAAIGIIVAYKAPGEDAGRTIAVLPAEDVLKIAEQAKSAKPTTPETTTAPADTTTAPAATEPAAAPDKPAETDAKDASK